MELIFKPFLIVWQAIKNLWRNKVLSLVSIFSVIATLVILGIVFSIILNLNSVMLSAQEQFDTVTAYLKEDVTLERLEELIADIKKFDGVTHVEYVSKEDALRILKVQWGENGYLLDDLEDNPLPTSLNIIFDDFKEVDNIVRNTRGLDGIEEIKSYQQIINKILLIMKMLKQGGMILIFILIAVSTFLIHNAIKLTLVTRENEIMIMKYVGATNWFIRWPFLVEGLILGSLGAGFAILIMNYGYQHIFEMIRGNMPSLLGKYFIDPDYIVKELTFLFFVIGCSIGILGSILSVRKNLKV